MTILSRRRATATPRPSRRVVVAGAHHDPVAAELARRVREGYPGCPGGPAEVEAALERWRDPEVVDRSLIRHALWEVERHFWKQSVCVCGFIPAATAPMFEAMRDHKEDVLANMLGLGIK